MLDRIRTIPVVGCTGQEYEQEEIEMTRVQQVFDILSSEATFVQQFLSQSQTLANHIVSKS